MRLEFIVPLLFVWTSAMIVAVLDFVHVQGMVYQFDLPECIGLIVVLAGFSVRKIAKKTLGDYFLNGVYSAKT